jgi:trimethylamine:corrinoid methyltransferase-like protein
MAKKHFEPVVRLQILDQASILKIHEATLQVLEETGVEINTDEGKKILLDAGCMISHDNVITIPASKAC